MELDLARHFLLDPEVVFLNHGSYGACPVPVFAAYQAWQARLERQPVAFLDPTRGLTQRLASVRAALAEELGTTPDALVGQTNATTALNLVAASLDLAPGDEILTSDHEYAALEKTWAALSARSGARVVVARVPLPLTSAEAFAAALTGAMTARTKVLFLSHVTSATALVFPLAPVLEEARRRGIFSLVDGAHAPGLIPLALDALGADAYAGNCHKWLLAPKGSAFLQVREDCQARIRPLVISHGWQEGAHGRDPGPFQATAFVDSLEMQGTRDPSAFLAVPAALEFRRLHGWPEVMRRCQEMAQETARRIARLTGLPPLSSPEFCAPQMVSLPLPDCDVAALKARLWAEWRIEIPCYRWQGRPFTRLSVQAYTTAAELEQFEQALAACLA